jgi:PAS domain S-box-containing protein
MRIRTQLLLVTATTAVVVLIALGSLWYVTQRSAANLRAQSESQDIARDVANLLTLTQEFTVYGGDRTTEQWHARYARLRQTVEQALAREPAPSPAFVRMRQGVLDLLPLYERLQGANRDPSSDLAQRRRELIIERLVSETQELVDARHRWATALIERQAREQSVANAIVLAASVVLVALMFGLAYLVARRGLVPLGRLQAAAAAIQRGDLSVRCDTSTRDELGDTGRAVNAMADSLLAANAALHRSEERYALAAAAANDGLWDWDLTTNMIYLSPRGQQIMLGRASDGIDTRHEREWQQWYQPHPDDVAPREAAIRDHLQGRTPRYEGEFRVRHPDGGYHWIHSRGICLRDASGRAIRFAGSTTDIDARKRAEDELRLRKEELQRLMESVSDYLWSAEVAADGSFAYRYYSPVVERILGRSPEYLLESPERWLGLVHPLDRPRLAEMFRGLISGATERVDVEYRIVRPDGGLRWLRDSAHGTRVEDGRILLYGVVGDITERKLAEEALRESEARFRALTELSSDWYWEQDENLRFTYLSSQANDLTGYSGESSLGKTRWELEGMTPLSSSWAEHRAVLVAHRPFRDLEMCRVAPDGTTRYLSVSGAPIFDEHGRFKGYQGIGRNITQRKEVEKSLQESERRFRQLFENSGDALFVHDAQGRFVDCNAAACRMLGYAREEVLKRSVADIAARLLSEKQRHAMNGETLWERAMRAEAGRIVGFEENELRRKDGTTLPVEVAVGAIDYEGRRLIYASVRETTERKRAEEELRSRQEMLELAQKSAKAIAFEWRIGPGEGQNRWSPDLEAMYGLAPGSYDGTFETWKKLVHPDDWRAVEEAIGQAQQTGDVASEYRVMHPDGSVHWLQAKGRMFVDREGKPARMVGFMQDVTQRRNAEEELRKMERRLRLTHRLEAMGTLAGGIAHDFNNILGAILGYGEMALRSAPKGSRLRRDLDSIMTAGERGRALVDRVLAFSRSGLGERVAVHVEKVVREALDLLEAKLPEGIRVEAKLRAGRAAMLGDPTQVHQVLMNLVTNAVQAMPSGGTLYVSLDTVRGEAARPVTIGIVEGGDYVVLTVSDTGTGIARDIIDRIFDPFFTTKEVGTGTGLGLSLVHGIVTELGGAIDVASVPGQGSEFTVYLPRSGEAVESDEGEAAAMPRGDGQRVLIVDDEEPLAGLAARTLEELGYLPTGFTSSTAALAAFRADPDGFDAVITDERMPGMTGTALIRELRRIRREIPILLMSGYVGGAVASGAREAGANEVMKKPLSAHELAASLARVLRQ